jgi:hypothetical protein
MRNFLYFFILSTLFVSCKSQQKEKTVPYLNANINNDTLYINTQAAVFYEPDSLKIERIKKKVGEENFYIGADDYNYYMHLSYGFIDSIKLPILRTENKKILKFISNDSSNEIIILDTLSQLWGVYFFDPRKKSKQADIVSIEDDYNIYFKHQP